MKIENACITLIANALPEEVTNELNNNELHAIVEFWDELASQYEQDESVFSDHLFRGWVKAGDAMEAYQEIYGEETFKAKAKDLFAEYIEFYNDSLEEGEKELTMEDIDYDNLPEEFIERFEDELNETHYCVPCEFHELYNGRICLFKEFLYYDMNEA